MTEAQKTSVAGVVALGVAVATLFAFTTPAAAFFMGGNGDDNEITVTNTNNATVHNTVHVDAKTGKNDADGGNGSRGGNGGSARGDGDNTGGRGGNGGNGALGGYIVTGDAAAVASVYNDVNRSNTTVRDNCGCEEERNPFNFFGNNDDNDIRVANRNHATVGNSVDVDAKTGGNDADGGNGSYGGNGGSATGDREHRGHFFFWWGNDDTDTNTGGNGGNGGHGGIGGEIYTGNATAGAEVSNVVNRNVTRVTRGN